MKHVFLLINLLPFTRAATTNAASKQERDHVTREEILSLFSEDFGRMSRL